MPSGALVTISGGTNMQQVVAGSDTVQPVDFNNARLNTNALLGSAAAVTLGTFTVASTFGYTQGGTALTAASTSGTIFADNATGGFKRLQDEVQNLCAFLGQTLRAGVGTDVTTSNTITAATWNNLMLNVKDCWDNRFTAAAYTTASGTAATRSTAWSSSITNETTYTFASAAAARGYFNAGGKAGVSSSRTDGAASSQNTDWTNLLSSIGDVFLTYNNATSSGSTGTSAGIGFYNLTTTYQQVYIKFGSGAYASNFFLLEARVNSTTAPTVVTLRATWSDPYVKAGSSDSIDGTLALTPRTQTPASSGSTLSFTAPATSAGAITGT
jgi:hypothetical protein